MQPTSYTLTFSEKERDALIFALGGAFRNVRDPGGMFISSADYLELSRRIMHARPDAAAVKSQSGTDAARAVLSSPSSPATASASAPAPTIAQPAGQLELRDRWARNKKGQEVPNPEGSATVTTKILRISDAPPRNDPAKPRKQVVFSGLAAPQAAYCWDSDLFPFLANRLGADRTILYLTKSGNYSNIVGIRA